MFYLRIVENKSMINDNLISKLTSTKLKENKYFMSK